MYYNMQTFDNLLLIRFYYITNNTPYYRFKPFVILPLHPVARKQILERKVLKIKVFTVFSS